MATEARATSTTELPKAYVPADFEAGIYERWLAADVFAPDGAGSRADPSLPPFTIIQPPPNITGSLHLGHAQRTAVEDLFIRHARMRGHRALFLPGLDHASIAAQYVLDRIIATEGESRESLGRERYLERMWQFINATREIMLNQQRGLGASADWGRLRFTMDEGSAKAVRVAFERLYRDGLAYRTEALINWCPGCRTSVSDLETIPTPETGTIWTIRYHLIDEATGAPSTAETISIATTRPETILGDTAVAVHPEDPRYAALVGRRARIPFVERDVPIVADAAVDRAFGSGAVKITPAHDQNDYELAKRHGLPMITVLDDAAAVNEAGDGYAGLDRYEARRRIVADLDARGDLVATAPHEMLIGRCQRSNDVIEPRLKTQWFIKAKPLADAALAATRSGETRIVPERFEKVWEHWLTNIRDWNVSRQLWWGHRIPAWYCPDGHITVSSDEHGPAACEVCGRPATELVQESDIFDTWFSSGLWPFSTLGWPDRTPDLETYYPTSVMETGHDILFFWVARMMMLGLQLTDVPPFHTVYLSGLIRDERGVRMSKTRGNSVDPLEVMRESGADAMRFALIHGGTSGQDQRFGPQKLETGRTFANKLWNATRYVLGARPASIPADAARRPPDPGSLGLVERWIRSRTAATVAEVDRGIGEYQLAEVTRALYDGIWSEFCDWGLEMAKARLADASLTAAEREATWWTLVESIDTFIRLLHPVMPYVTEALWAALPHAADDPELVIVARWPVATPRDAEAETAVEPVLDLVRAIRNVRAEAGVAPGAWLAATLAAPAGEAEAVRSLAPVIERLARLRPVTLGSAAASPDRLAVVAGRLEASIDSPSSTAAAGSGPSDGGASSGGAAGASSGAHASSGGGASRGGAAASSGAHAASGSGARAASGGGASRGGAGAASGGGNVSAGAAARPGDRGRLEKELETTEQRLAAARARLADPNFTSRAPAAVVDGARRSEAELAAQAASLREKLGLEARG